MTQIHQCSDQSDAIPLYPVLGLFLKPIARINVTVHFPTLKQSLPTGGKSVSSWEVMEKIKGLVAPENFISLKVVKNTLEFIRFEGDLENRSVLKTIVTRLDGRSLKLTGFKELLKIRAAETKIQFPSKYDWDSFFRDARHMNEMKAGERPDTIHFQCLPCKWFAVDKKAEKPSPSEKLFRRVWENFGEVRCVDIPVLDPYRQQMQPNIAGIKTFTFSQDTVFEAYVQYKDYLSFVKAMDALRGCFLMHQEGNKSWVVSIKVNFDKSKHLSDESIRKRNLERERLIEDERMRERVKLKAKADATTKATTVSNGKSPPEKDLSSDVKRSVEYKIALEERMYMVARRKLESVRLLDYIFDRIKTRHLKESSAAANKGGFSERSSVSKSDRLSPSFYNAERSPRIDDSRSPQSKTKSRRSLSPRKNRSRSPKPPQSRSPFRRRSESRDRSSSRHRSHTRRRTLSRSRSRSRNRSGSHHRLRDHSLDRLRDRRRSSDEKRSPSPVFGNGRSPARERRNSHEIHSSRPHSSRPFPSPPDDFRGVRDGRYPKNYYEGKIPRDSNNYYNYVNDWEMKPRGNYYNPADRGRGSFRRPGRAMHRGTGGRRLHAYNYDYANDSAYLQEAYNHAYTKYFKSISKTTESDGHRSPHEDTGYERIGSRSPSRSPRRSNN